MKNPTVLALANLGGSWIGWAYRRRTGTIEHGLEPCMSTGAESRGNRYLRFDRWLERVGAQEGLPDAVYYCAGAPMRGSAACRFAAVEAVLLTWCARHRINRLAIEAAAILGHATSDSTAAAVAAASRGLAQRTLHDDERRALAVLHFALRVDTCKLGPRAREIADFTNRRASLTGPCSPQPSRDREGASDGCW